MSHKNEEEEFERLPNDTVFIIFEFCDIRDLISITRVSKNWSWCELAKSDIVWKNRFNESMNVSSIKKEKDRLEEIELHKTFFQKFVTLKQHELDFRNRHFIKYIPPVMKIDKKSKKGYSRGTIKIVAVGDGAVGKTCKIDYDRLRPLSYPGTSLFLLCFSVTNRNSFDNVRTKWIGELNHHLPEAPVVVCGNKIDLRNDPYTLDRLADEDLKIIEFMEGYNLAESIGAAGYCETSAKTREGVDECFEVCKAVALGDYVAKDMSLFTPRKKKKKKDKTSGGCMIM